MKKLIGFILLLPLILLDVSAQDQFYYTFDKQKPLEINPESFSIIFKEKVNWQKLVKPSHPLVKEIHGQKQTTSERIIIELHEKNEKLEELVAELVLDPNMVKDFHWGFKINPRLPVWLTDNLLFEPSDKWNEKEVNALLLQYPQAKINQNEFGYYSINVSQLSHSIEIGNKLVERGLVNWAQPDFMGGYTLFYNPPDPKYWQQFYFNNTGQLLDGVSWTPDIDINAPEAWDLSFGSSSIKVGVLDEGVEDHEDMYDDMGVSKVLPGFSAAGTGTGESQTQFEGHGQAVAGLINASHNNLGIAGIAPNVKVVPAYVAADLTTIVSNISNSFAWLWQTANVDIINNSYGFKSCDPNLYPAIVSAIDDAQLNGRGGLGCVVVFASGENDGTGTTCLNFPGNRANVITAGSIDGNGSVPFYSPFGPNLDIVVPSSWDIANVRSIDRMDTATLYADRIGLNTGNYVEFFGGTSSSCAIASGVVALILSEDPNLDYTDVETILTSTAMDIGAVGKDDSTGSGMLRADDAVSMAIGGFPVEWLDFKADLINDRVELEWLTASEQNNAFFEIQRSNGTNFRVLGSKAGAGNSTEVNSYTYTDDSPNLGTNYYRIKQVDVNGSFSYSSVIEISRDKSGELAISEVYPNPAKDQIHLKFALSRGNNAVAQVLDMKGRVLFERSYIGSENIQEINIKTEDFVPGIYVLAMKSQGGKILSKRFLVNP